MAKKKENPLEEAIKHIESVYGKGSIMRLEDEKVENVPVIPTGSINLDKALIIGGYPKGRIIEVFGPESVGKSSFSLHATANVQKDGGNVAIIETEHAFDKLYAKKLGVDTKKLYFSQPNSGEEALEIADHLIRSGGMDLIVVDSVAALTPKAELEGEMGDSRIGLQARLMSQAMRKIAANVGRTSTTVMFINQLREKINVMFGSPYVTSGGNALKFYSSVRLDIRRMGQITEKEEVVGHRVRVNVIKNKLASPFRKAEFDIIYGEGISKSSEIIDLGIEHGIIQKSGSWYSYGDTKLGQGKDNVRLLLNDNPELTEELEKKIKAKMS